MMSKTSFYLKVVQNIVYGHGVNELFHKDYTCVVSHPHAYWIEVCAC